MKKIQVNLEALESEILKLKQLQSDCRDYKMKRALIDGNGKILVKAIEIENFYQTIQNTYLDLIDSSINFFENTKKNYENADNTATEKIVRKGE